MTDLPLVPRDPPPAQAYVPLEFVHDEPTLAQWFGAVWSYRWLSLSIIVTGFVLTAATMFWWPRTYTATTSLIVHYEVTDPLNGKELPVGQLSNYIATQVELLQTPDLLLDVVDRHDLTRHRDYVAGYQSRSGSLRHWAAAEVAKSLSVYQSQHGSQLIYVAFSARGRALAADVANSVVEVYQTQDAARAAGPPAERAKRHAAQLDALKAQVDEAQRAATGFQQRHGLADDGSRTDVDVLRLAALEERLLATQNVRHAAQLRAAQDPAASDQVLASLQAQTLQAQITTAEQRVAQLNRIYTPLYPDIREARQQADDARQALAVTVRSYTDNASAGLDVTQRLELGLQSATEAQRARVLARGRLQDEAAKYRLELASAQAVYQRSLEGFDQIKFASAIALRNVGVVSRATPPVAASRPKVPAGLALGGTISLLLGLGLPLLLDRLRPRVRSRDDLVLRHGVPVLAEFARLPVRADA
jgi:uncharacterized protein involved in exopolysaccharide biosynthesis